MSATGEFAYPQPKDDDDDDVVWALQAGAVEWQRGGLADALVWLKRAVEAANAAGNAFRAGEVQAAVDELAEQMWGDSPTQAPPSAQEIDIPVEGDDEVVDDADLDDAIDDLDPQELSDDDLVAEEAWVEDENTGEHFPDLNLGGVAALPGFPAPGGLDAPLRDADALDVALGYSQIPQASERDEDDEEQDPYEDDAGEAYEDDEVAPDEEPLEDAPLEDLLGALGSESQPPSALTAPLLTDDLLSAAPLASDLDSLDADDLDAEELDDDEIEELDDEALTEVPLADESLPDDEDASLAQQEATGGFLRADLLPTDLLDQQLGQDDESDADEGDLDEGADDEDDLDEGGMTLPYEEQSAAEQTRVDEPISSDVLSGPLLAPPFSDSTPLEDPAQDEALPQSGVAPYQEPAVAGAVGEDTVVDDSLALSDVGLVDVTLPEVPEEDRQTGIMELVASVHPPAIDRGADPVDDSIAGALEPEIPASAVLPALPLAQAATPLESVVEPEGPPELDGIPLSECLGFEKLPEKAQRLLVRSVRREVLARDEEINDFGAALVTHGAVAVVTAISDEPALMATKGDVVFSEGSLQHGTQLRIVAAVDDTAVALWRTEDLEQALRDCPWVREPLRSIADRFQALAGTTLGVLGERLDASLRRTVTDRMQVRACAPGEMVLQKGVALPGLHILGAGRIELLDDDDSVQSESLPGDFLFPEAVLVAAPAPCSARAGPKGALLLFASRSVAHELVTSVPPLLEALVS